MTDQSLPARLTASLATALNSRSATIDAANETTNEAGKDQRQKTRRGEHRRRDGEELRLGPQGPQQYRRRGSRHGAAAAKIDNLGGANLAKSATCVSKQPLSLAYPGAMAAAFVISYAQTYVSLAGGPWQTSRKATPIIMLGAAWLAWQQRRKLALRDVQAGAGRGLDHPDRLSADHGGHPSQNIGVCLTWSAGRNREFSEDD